MLDAQCRPIPTDNVDMTGPAWWWLSFVDRTETDGLSVACHLGVTIVYVEGNVSAATQTAWTNTNRCNPGGEVLGQRMPDVRRIPQRFTYRLLTNPADIIEANLAIATDLQEQHHA